MTRRRRRAWFGLGVLLALLAVIAPPAASAATESWEFDTPTYDFGSALAGAGPTEPHEFTLTNTGDTQLEVKRFGVSERGPLPLDPGLFSATFHSCKTLEPGKSCSADVVFNPLTVGPKQGSVWVETASGDPPRASVELEGEGADLPVAVEPAHVDFGSVEVGKEAPLPQTIKVENQGSFNLAIKGVSFTSLLGVPQPSSPFRIVGGSCHEGGAVPPHGSCTLMVSLAPSEVGFFQARLSISDNAPDSPQRIELQGIGTPPAQGQPWPSASALSPEPANVIHREFAWKFRAEFGRRTAEIAIPYATCQRVRIRASVAERGGRAVITSYADEPIPDHSVQCLGVRGVRHLRVRLKAPLERLKIFDGSFDPPKQRWP